MYFIEWKNIYLCARLRRANLVPVGIMISGYVYCL